MGTKLKQKTLSLDYSVSISIVDIFPHSLTFTYAHPRSVRHVTPAIWFRMASYFFIKNKTLKSHLVKLFGAAIFSRRETISSCSYLIPYSLKSPQTPSQTASVTPVAAHLYLNNLNLTCKIILQVFLSQFASRTDLNMWHNLNIPPFVMHFPRLAAMAYHGAVKIY